jgi:CTP synthase (UTP-ammonia lyase)
VLGIKDAEHEESAPDAPTLFISRLACSLAGKTQRITIAPESLARRAYGEQEVVEQFYCNFGLNPRFRKQIKKGELNVTGVDPEGEVRIVELSGHPFYVATLYLPQVCSKPESPHPLIVAFLKAAAAFKARRNSEQNPQ